MKVYSGSNCIFVQLVLITHQNFQAEVVHILVHEVHSYILDWECDWSTLDKVLLSLGKLHRFSDVGINLCNTIERTLEAGMPTAPDYLKGAEMLTSVLDAKLPEKGSGTYTAPAQLSIEQSRAMALSRVDAESFLQFKEQVTDNSTVVAESFTQPALVSLSQADVSKPLTQIPASSIKLIVECSSGGSCNSVDTPKSLSPFSFNS